MLALTISTSQWITVVIAAFAAGCIDAIVGGGGLIQLPVLLLTLPNVPVVKLLGTNKLASVFGTSSAAIVYNRRVAIDRREAAAMALLAAAGSMAGAFLATTVQSASLKPIVIAALAGVFAYVWRNPSAGAVSAPRLSPATRRAVTFAGATVIGAYDGFLGPGTGSFLIFLLVGAVGLNFLEASAISKVVNAATNVAAIILFVSQGAILFGVGAAMAAANLTGSQIGSRLAIARGSTWVRKVFLIVVAALLVRLTYDVITAA